MNWKHKHQNRRKKFFADQQRKFQCVQIQLENHAKKFGMESLIDNIIDKDYYNFSDDDREGIKNRVLKICPSLRSL